MTEQEATKMNGWTFEETVKTAENLMESEKNMFKWDVLRHLRDFAENFCEEIQQYRAIGTIEELQKAEKEEDILKFYYCDSEDSYLVGLRIGNFYYAHYIDGRWVFDMPRHLPWGEHVVDDTSAWKEHTYPSEPKEINFSEFLNGFIKKECGGTPEECRAAVEKQKAKKPIMKQYFENLEDEYLCCPTCGEILTDRIPADNKTFYFHCMNCGQKFDWSDEE